MITGSLLRGGRQQKRNMRLGPCCVYPCSKTYNGVVGKLSKSRRGAREGTPPKKTDAHDQKSGRRGVDSRYGVTEDADKATKEILHTFRIHVGYAPTASATVFVYMCIFLLQSHFPHYLLSCVITIFERAPSVLRRALWQRWCSCLRGILQ